MHFIINLLFKFHLNDLFHLYFNIKMILLINLKFIDLSHQVLPINFFFDAMMLLEYYHN